MPSISRKNGPTNAGDYPDAEPEPVEPEPVEREVPTTRSTIATIIEYLVMVQGEDSEDLVGLSKAELLDLVGSGDVSVDAGVAEGSGTGSGTA